MPNPVTVFKEDKMQKNVYPSELHAWIKEGWSTQPPSKKESPPQVDKPIKVLPPLNLNQASLNELETLEGVGEATAKGLLALRKESELTLGKVINQFPRVEWDKLNIAF